jgi:hypothetical protein
VQLVLNSGQTQVSADPGTLAATKTIAFDHVNFVVSNGVAPPPKSGGNNPPPNPPANQSGHMSANTAANHVNNQGPVTTRLRRPFE